MICLFCSYEWAPRKPDPKVCPRCKHRLDWPNVRIKKGWKPECHNVWGPCSGTPGETCWYCPWLDHEKAKGWIKQFNFDKSHNASKEDKHE